jgi:hypothetical protein
MMQSTEPHSHHALPRRRPSRAARIAWRTGWVLLALASMTVTYGWLVYNGH